MTVKGALARVIPADAGIPCVSVWTGPRSPAGGSGLLLTSFVNAFLGLGCTSELVPHLPRVGVRRDDTGRANG